MKTYAGEKGWRVIWLRSGGSTDGARASASWPGRGLPRVPIDSGLRDLYEVAGQLLFLE